MICFIFCSDLEGRHLVSHSTDLHSVAANKCFNLSLSSVSKQLGLSRPGPSRRLWWRRHALQNVLKALCLFFFVCSLGREACTAGAGELRATPRRCPGACCEVEGTSQALTREGRGVFGVGDGAESVIAQEEVPAGRGLRKAV